MKLFQKYRPAQPKVCARLRSMIERNAIAGNAFLITGQSGTGKIAREVADAMRSLREG